MLQFTPQYQNTKSTFRQALLTVENMSAIWRPILEKRRAAQALELANEAMTANGTIISSNSESIQASRTRFEYPVIVDSKQTPFAIFNRKTFAKGGSSKIELAQNLLTKEFVLVKISSLDMESIEPERDILKQLGLLKGFYTQKRGLNSEKSWIFMTMLPGITLEKFILLCEKYQFTLSQEIQARIFLALLQAMDVLLKQDISHEDLGAQNILFDPLSMTAHIIDFTDCFIVTKNNQRHHQHLAIHKLYHAVAPLLKDRFFEAIAHHYLLVWENLKTNFAKAISETESFINEIEERKASRVKRVNK